MSEGALDSFSGKNRALKKNDSGSLLSSISFVMIDVGIKKWNNRKMTFGALPLKMRSLDQQH